MAALLIAMSIMAVMMTVVMPVWKHAAQREKEEELVFRGQQYARAIGLFQRKFANAYPPNIDVLVDQKFLRKKFKDPITNDDFVPLRGRAGAPARPAAAVALSPDSPQRGSHASRARDNAGDRSVNNRPRPSPAARCAACRRSARRARAEERRRASAVSPARAKRNQFASITAATITTSGRSSTCRRFRRPAQAAPGTTQPGQIPGQRGGPGQRGRSRPARRSPGPGPARTRSLRPLWTRRAASDPADNRSSHRASADGRIDSASTTRALSRDLALRPTRDATQLGRRSVACGRVAPFFSLEIACNRTAASTAMTSRIAPRAALRSRISPMPKSEA